MVNGTNGNRPEDHIVNKHVTAKIGPRNPKPQMPPPAQPKKRSWWKKLFGLGAFLLLIAFGSAVLGIAGLADIFGTTT